MEDSHLVLEGGEEEDHPVRGSHTGQNHSVWLGHRGILVLLALSKHEETNTEEKDKTAILKHEKLRTVFLTDAIS